MHNRLCYYDSLCFRQRNFISFSLLCAFQSYSSKTLRPHQLSDTLVNDQSICRVHGYYSVNHYLSIDTYEMNI